MNRGASDIKVYGFSGFPKIGHLKATLVALVDQLFAITFNKHRQSVCNLVYYQSWDYSLYEIINGKLKGNFQVILNL